VSRPGLANTWYNVDMVAIVPARDPVDGPAVRVSASHPSTSRDMAAKANRSGALRRDVLEALYQSADTDDGLEARLGRTHQSTSACRRNLVLDGLVEAVPGLKRPTRSGNLAVVWRLTAAGHEKVSNARRGGK
jgi:hypothetical protein